MAVIRLIVPRSFRPVFSAAMCAGIAAFATAGVAQAAPKDAAARALATEAMSTDYPNGNYVGARKKLRRALKQCGKRRCSRKVRAELQRALGVAYLGDGKSELAHTAFQRAVKLDPAGRIGPDLETPEVNAAYEKAGGKVEEFGSSRSESESGEDSESSDSSESANEEDSDAASSDERDADDASARRRTAKGSKSWLSLSLQQEWLLYSGTRPVCGTKAYTCLQGEAEYGGAIWPTYGNQVSGGLALATTRVLAGFEYLLGENFALGLRLGYAFRGGPTLRNAEKFLPAHAELRMAYYLGSKPFARSGVRPYLAVAGGLAEVRSSLDVDFYEDAVAYNEARKQSVQAWRNTGRTFVAPTVGTQLAFTRTFALTLELRWMVMLGTSGHAPAASIGFAQGL